MFNILIVEDELQIGEIVAKYLQRNDMTCYLVNNGFKALEQFSKETYHLVILDVMMPGIDGFEVLDRLREVSDLPIIMLTAKEEEVDRLKGFKKGADDYVVKPFSPRELVERVKVMLKRTYKDVDQSLETINITIGDLTLYPAEMRVICRGQEIELTSAEFKLLHTFMKHKQQVLTREQLIELAFGIDYDGIDRNIDTYIKRIRQKIEENPKSPVYLKTKYGLGYLFDGGNS